MSAFTPSPSWTLKCPWCEWIVWVNARGARGNDPGSGVEAAKLAMFHCEHVHGKTWAEFLAARPESA